MKDRILKLTGSVEISEGEEATLKYQKEYSLTVQGELVKIEDYSTQDEGSKKRYTIKVSNIQL